METESLRLGQKFQRKQSNSGLRRLSLAMLATDKLAEAFSGLPAGQEKPGAALAAFKAAAPYLGLPPRLVHAVDWLFRFTQPQDWASESRPIVWPSAALQREALGIGVTQAKALNRHLVELGLVVMKDSPNGKRYGRRDGMGRIIEAYGFDLSPLGARIQEFQAVAEKGRAEREAMRQLRRRATIARKGLSQILETAAEIGLIDQAWESRAEEACELAKALGKSERRDELEAGVVALERRQREARERLEKLIVEAPDQEAKSVDSDPKGSENRPHQYTYKPPFYPEQDTVIAHQDCSGRDAGIPPSNQPKLQQDQGQQLHQAQRRTKAGDREPVVQLTPDELVRLTPRLRPYLSQSAPTWPEIVDAAAWLRHDLGVSKSLWGDACITLGREQAAIALAIVSTKPAGYFRSSPGGYFYGMVMKAKTGELNLSRTVWGLRTHEEVKASTGEMKAWNNCP